MIGIVLYNECLFDALDGMGQCGFIEACGKWLAGKRFGYENNSPLPIRERWCIMMIRGESGEIIELVVRRGETQV